jgi:hypothetical protein
LVLEELIAVLLGMIARFVAVGGSIKSSVSEVRVEGKYESDEGGQLGVVNHS